MSSLIDQLIKLETSLHKKQIRNDRSKLESLLHEDFHEFGSSGKRWSRSEIIEALVAETQDIESNPQNFQLHRLSEDIAQLTYVSGSTLRSSLWKLEQGNWKMIFHQGTKTHF